jgi:hypothetical protein
LLDLGTVRPGSTLRIPFSTYDKDDGASITQTNYATSDILVYKDGSTTERASTAGYTATTDFDGKTGKHLAIIDLADNTTAGFWAAGSEYLVAIDAVTVDAVTTGGWIARFRIGYPNALLDTTIATLTNQTSFTLTVGPAEDDALNNCLVAIHDVASAVQMGFAVISDYTGSTKTVTLTAGTTFTAAATDNISIFPPVSVAYAAAVAWNSGAIQAATLATDTLTAAKVASDVGTEIGTAVWASGTRTLSALDEDNTTLDLDATIRAAVGLATANLDTQLGDLPTAAENTTAVWAAAARTLTALDEDSTTLDLDATIRGAVGLASANLDTQIGDLPTNAELSTALGTADDAVLAAIAALNDLDAAGIRSAVGLASANLDAQLGDLPTAAENFSATLTTQLTESYAADGAAPTLAQAVLAIQQFLQERAVSGTTLTVNKLDGTTSAMTFTLDDGTSPTAITRAS